MSRVEFFFKISERPGTFIPDSRVRWIRRQFLLVFFAVLKYLYLTFFQMKLVELPLPTLRHIKSKEEEINTSKTYSYKDDDIEAVI